MSYLDKRIIYLPKKILLDTSFLIEAVNTSSGLDILNELSREYELYITSGVLNELNRLSLRKGKVRLPARVILEWIKAKDVKVISSDCESVDRGIYDIAKSGEYIVATGDRDLREKLMKHNVRILYFKKGGKPYII